MWKKRILKWYESPTVKCNIVADQKIGLANEPSGNHRRILQILTELPDRSNQIFHCTRCIMPKRVMSSQVVHCARQHSSFVEMLQLWQAIGNSVSDLNLTPPAPETNVLLLDQLARPSCYKVIVQLLIIVQSAQCTLLLYR